MDIPELVSIEDYNVRRAKLSASLLWLLSKAYNGNIPEDYREPFSEDQQGELQINESVVEELISANVYIRACHSIFGDMEGKEKSHQTVIEILARHGFYVMDGEENIVCDLDLRLPFKESCHLALIDTIMMCASTRWADVGEVVRTVRTMVPGFSASNELPNNIEEALLWWLNKVCTVLQQRLSTLFPNHAIAIETLTDLKDLSDGCCLACVLHTYQPDLLRLQDIAMTSPIGIADSLHNLQLVSQACRYLLCWCLDITDLFYIVEELRPNLIVLLAELFFNLHTGLPHLHRTISSPLSPVSSISRASNSQMLSNVSMDSELSLNFDAKYSVNISNDETAMQHKKSLQGLASTPRLQQADGVVEASSSKEKVKSQDFKKEAKPPQTLTFSDSLVLSNNAAARTGSSLNKELVDKTESSASTPSDEYKTPSVEIVSFADALSAGGKPSLSHSYTLNGRQYTPASARAAGLPIVNDSAMRRKEEEIWEANSSSGSSDVELRKLRGTDFADDDDGEPCDVCNENDLMSQGHDIRSSNNNQPARSSDSSNLARKSNANNKSKNNENIDKKAISSRENERHSKQSANAISFVGDNGSAVKTSFAALKKQSVSESVVSAESFPIQKQTAFTPFSNQTTWKENALRNAQSNKQSLSLDSDVRNVTEMTGVRMKLEERRQQMMRERKMAEVKTVKERQQLGKQALLTVLSADQDNISAPNYVKNTENSILSSTANEQKKKHLPVSAEMKRIDKGAKFDSFVRERNSAEQIVTADNLELNMQDRSFLSSVQSSGNNMKTEGLRQSSEIYPNHNQSSHGLGQSNEIYPNSNQTGHVRRGSDLSQDLPSYGSSLERLNTNLEELRGQIMRLSLQQTGNGDLADKRFDKSDHLPSSSIGGEGEPNYALSSGMHFGTQGVASHLTADSRAFSHSAAELSSTVARSQYALANRPSSHHLPSSSMPLFLPPWHSALPLASPLHGTSYLPASPSIPGVTYNTYTAPSGIALVRPPQIYPNQISAVSQGHMHSVEHLTSIQSVGLVMSSHEFLPSVSPSNTSSTVQFDNAQKEVESDLNSHQLNTPGRRQSSGGNVYNPLNSLNNSKVTNNFSPSIVQGISQSQRASYLPPIYISENLKLPLLNDSMSQKVNNNVTLMPSADSQLVDSEDSFNTREERDNVEGGFFVSLDSNLPLRVKPQLSARSKTNKSSNPNPNSAEKLNITGQNPAEIIQSENTQETTTLSSATTLSAPPIGFTVADSSDAMVNEDDLEQRKRKMLQLQLKRQEEREKKLQMLGMELEEKREMDRIKKEQQELKKAEEKARKEAILQQHRQKKQSDGVDGKFADDDSRHPPSALHHAVQRRAKTKSKSSRPQSQPPVRGGIAGDEASLGSLEELSRRTGVPPSRKNSTTQLADSPAQLAYGGLTHRRAPSPDVMRSGRLLEPDDTIGGGEACQVDYTGPRLFVKPSQKSNRHLIGNALSYCCLAGTVNEKVKKEVLEELARSSANHFVILFRDANQQFRGLYTYYPDSDDIIKIYGLGPRQITDQMFDRFYKYNSGSKSFSQIMTTKHMSATIDAVTIQSHLWKGKPSIKKPLTSQY